MAYKSFEPFQLEGDELIKARKASADIRAALQVMAQIVGKHNQSLAPGAEKVTIAFDPAPAGISQSSQTHSDGPGGHCYIYQDPPGICKPCPM